MTSDFDDIRKSEAPLNDINAALPRRVRLYSDDARRLFWCVAIFLGVGAIWFCGYFPRVAREVSQWAVLQREGSETIGEIRERNKSLHAIFIRYKFSVGNEVYQNTVELPTNYHIDSSVGETISIRFLPSDPAVNYPSTWGFPVWRDFVPNLFMLLFPVLGCVGAVFLYRERHLARKGLVADGRVTGCEPNGRKFKVYYEFLTENDMTFEGVDNYSDEYDVGSKIPVIYLRKNPRRNDSYPMTSYRTE
jgi:hypothetical protein